MDRKLLVFAMAVAFIVSLLVSVVPVSAWTYPDCTEDDRYENWGPRIDRLWIRLYADESSEFVGFQNGEIDIVDWPIPKDYQDTWSQPPHNESIKLLSYGAEYGMFLVDINCNPNEYLGNPPDPDYPNPVYPNPCSSPYLREALWHLMDRGYVVGTICGGTATPIYTVVPPCYGAYAHPDIKPGGALEDLCHLYDTTKANQLLDEGGFSERDPDGWRIWNETGETVELKFYIRSDHEYRYHMGQWFADQIEAAGIKVNRIYKDSYGCWLDVMLAKNFHLYTAGWGLGADPDHLVLWQWAYYWHPGFAYNYAGVHIPEFDYWADKVIYALSYDEAKEAAWKAQEAYNSGPNHNHPTNPDGDGCGSIPVFSMKGVKAIRRRYCGPEEPYTGQLWKQIVNMPGYGCDTGGTFMNAYPEGHPMGDCETMTMRYGYKVPELKKLNPVYAEWLWDWNTLGLIYESLLSRNPYTLEFEPWLAKDFETFTWEDPVTHETKSGVRFTIRPDVYWHDGTPFSAADVIYTLWEFPKELIEAGFPPPWWYSNVRDILSFYLIDPCNVEILLDVTSVWAVGWVGGNIILPKHIWKQILEDAIAGTVEIEGFAPDPNLIGTGPFRLAEYVADDHITMLANKPGLTIDTGIEGSVPITNPYGYFRWCPVHVNVHILEPYLYLQKVPPGEDFTVRVTLHNDWVNPIPNTAGGDPTGFLQVYKLVTLVHPDETEETLFDGTVGLNYCEPHVEDFALNLAKGHYQIKAAVHIIGPEMITVTKEGGIIEIPNPFVCQWINVTFDFWVTISEDISGAYFDTWHAGYEEVPAPDCKVDIRDIAAAAAAFGSYPGAENWNSVADLTKDYKVDIRDIAAIAAQYGFA